MKRDALARKFDRLLVWKVSRLGRSMRDVIDTVYQLADNGLTVYPVKLQTGPINSTHGKLLWAIQAWYAEMENEERSDAVQAGQARARADGKHIGRPKDCFDSCAPSQVMLIGRGFNLRQRYYAAIPIITLLLIQRATSQQLAPEMIDQSEGSEALQTKVVFGGNGKWLATIDYQGKLRIFDLEAGRLSRVIAAGARTIAPHPSKNAIAATDRAGVVALYDIATGKSIWRSLQGFACRTIAFAVDGGSLYAGCYEKPDGQRIPKAYIKILDADTGRELSSRQVTDKVTYLLAFSPTGQWYAGLSKRSLAGQIFSSSTARDTPGFDIFETLSGRKIGEVRGSALLGLSAVTNRAITVNIGSRMRIWDVTAGKQLDPGASTAAGRFARVSRDERLALLCGDRVQLLDLTTGQARPLAVKERDFGDVAALAPDNDLIAFAQRGRLLLFRASKPEERIIIGDPTGEPLPSGAMQPLTDSTSSPDNETQAATMTFGMASAAPSFAAFIDSGRLFAVLAADGWWDVWDVGTGYRLPFRKPLRPSAGKPWYLADLRDIEESLTGRFGSAPTERRLTSNGEVACKSDGDRYRVEISREAGRLTSAVWHAADGRQIDLLAGGADLSAWEWNAVTARSPQHPYLCALNADGSHLVVEKLLPSVHRNNPADPASQGAGSSFRPETSDGFMVYESRDGKKICELEHMPGVDVFDLLADELRFSRDGKWILGGRNPSNGFATGSLQASLRIWETATCRRLNTLVGGAPGMLGFSEDGRQLFTAAPGSRSSGIRVWDTPTVMGHVMAAEPRFEMPDLAASAETVIVPDHANAIIGPDRASSLGFWDRRTGERLGTLHAYPGGEWLVTTPAGVFDGSPRGWTAIAWRDSPDQLSTKSPEIFFNEFYRPGLLAELLRGARPSAPRTIAQVDRRQPNVSTSTDTSSPSERYVTVRISVAEEPASALMPLSSGVRDLRLFRNESLVRAWRGDLALTAGRASFEAVVPVVAGENRFAAYAFNRDNIKSQNARLVVRSTSQPRKGTAYVLSIGVNQYSNPEFNLSFAAPDARRLAEVLTQKERALGVYDKVVTVNLLDAYATRANILLALSRLGGQHTGEQPKGAPPDLLSLQKAQPEDTVIVYFAGHGTAFGDRFYLIPHDLGYSEASENRRNSLKKLLDSSISDEDLDRAFEPIDTSNLMLIIDACQSGKALDSDDYRFGPLNNKGLAQLAYDKGMYVLTASQAYQTAIESSRLGHGYLTYALVEEGLTAPAADIRPADGRITVIEWFEYAVRRVPQLQMESEEATGKGRDLKVDDSGRLQRPRLYYRRDDAAPPLVIAVR